MARYLVANLSQVGVSLALGALVVAFVAVSGPRAPRGAQWAVAVANNQYVQVYPPATPRPSWRRYLVTFVVATALAYALLGFFYTEHRGGVVASSAGRYAAAGGANVLDFIQTGEPAF